jgi:hypothetical protein
MKAGTDNRMPLNTLKGMAYHDAVVADLLVERKYSLSRPPSVSLRQR